MTEHTIIPETDDLRDQLANCSDYDTFVFKPGLYHYSPRIADSAAWSAEPLTGGAALVLAGKVGVRLIFEDGAVLAFTDGNGLAIANCTGTEVVNLHAHGSGYRLEPRYWYEAIVLLAGTNRGTSFHGGSITDYPNHGIGHLMSGWEQGLEVSGMTFARGGALVRPGLGQDGAAIAVHGVGIHIAHCTGNACLRFVEVESKFDDLTSDVCVEDCLALNTLMHAFMVTPTNADFRNIVFRRNQVWTEPGFVPVVPAYNKTHPFTCTGCRGLCLEHNTFVLKPTDWCGFDCTPDRAPITGLVITDNQVYGGERHGISLGSTQGVPSNGVRNGWVCSNRVVRPGGYCIYYEGPGHYILNNDLVPSDRYPAIYGKE